MSKKQNKSQKLSAQQKADHIKAAQEREARALQKKEREQKTKQIFTIVVCVILVLALGLPTVGLAVLGG
ncbi:MAG: CASC3 protein CASC3 [Coriobacteriia bacterium]|nr:CASC3 protein CASC3 [Coriobacteriia bacterium]